MNALASCKGLAASCQKRGNNLLDIEVAISALREMPNVSAK